MDPSKEKEESKLIDEIEIKSEGLMNEHSFSQHESLPEATE